MLAESSKYIFNQIYFYYVFVKVPNSHFWNLEAVYTIENNFFFWKHSYKPIK